VGCEVQAGRYIRELATCCETLAKNPALGRSCDYIRPGLRRFEHGKHVLFYSQKPKGILLSRILHQSMLPEIHKIDD
jgi:toxin ParE1/3/4